jgi:GNAT superfamily N-acetyltransferase
VSAMDEHICELRDGTRALVRPIRAQDKARLLAGFDALSEETRLLRFHVPTPRLSEEQVRYLTEIDYVDHMAWVAVDLDRDGHPGMGVARYIRIPEEPHVAEAAVTVVDAYQGKGLGTVLLGHLSRSAREHGIEVFRNYVLEENTAMLELLEDLGASRRLEEPGVYTVDMPLSSDDDETDTPAGRVFRAVASGSGHAPWLAFPVAWFRRFSRLPELRLQDDQARGAGNESPQLRAYLDRVLKVHHEAREAREAQEGRSRDDEAG